MRKLTVQLGFTLIEILIVVILLGIIATIIVPQFIVIEEDAKLNTLKTNLKNLRNTIDLYYHQHNKTFPGFNDVNGEKTEIKSKSRTAFVQQLTRYTDITGKVSAIKDSNYKFGAYIRSDVLPTNPYNDKNDITCDVEEKNITVKISNGATGWKFYVKTGILIANDGAHDNL